MPKLTNTFAAVALSFAMFAPAKASETVSVDTNRQGATVPAVISVAYRAPQIATSARDVGRQGGFAIAGATRWAVSTEQDAPVGAFTAPGVISAAYDDPRIIISSTGVIRQGGLATAGTVRWLGGSPVIAETKAEAVRLGAL